MSPRTFGGALSIAVDLQFLMAHRIACDRCTDEPVPGPGKEGAREYITVPLPCGLRAGSRFPALADSLRWSFFPRHLRYGGASGLCRDVVTHFSVRAWHMCAHLPRLGRAKSTRLVLTISRVDHHEDTADAGARSMSGFCPRRRRNLSENLDFEYSTVVSRSCAGFGTPCCKYRFRWLGRLQDG